MSHEELTARQRWQRRIDNLLANSYNLGVTSGAEVLTVVLWDGTINHYATEGLEPMINQDAGRKLLIKLLTKDDKKPGPPPTDRHQQEEQERAAVKFFSGEMPPDPIEDPVLPEVDTESSQPIEEPQAREKAFKEQVAAILHEAQDISLLKRPAKGAEVLVLIATPAQKVFSWATARLEPLIKTEQGRSLISSILQTASQYARPIDKAPAAAQSSSSGNHAENGDSSSSQQQQQQQKSA